MSARDVAVGDRVLYGQRGATVRFTGCDSCMEHKTRPLFVYMYARKGGYW